MKFKLLMFLGLVATASINMTEESLHEYLGLMLLVLFVLHLLGQGWWLAASFPKFSRPMRLKSEVSILVILFSVLTVVSGLLLSRYALPFLRVKEWQAVLIDVHHFCGGAFILLCCFHFGLHLNMKKTTGKAILFSSLVFFLLSGLIYAGTRLVDYGFLEEFEEIVFMFPEALQFIVSSIFTSACFLLFGWLIQAANSKRLSYA